jgi:hypothetical protein
MFDVALAITHLILYLVAYFWIVGFIPIHWKLRVDEGGGYNLRRDVTFSAAFLIWMFAGFALFRWIIPAPFNPFYG